MIFDSCNPRDPMCVAFEMWSSDHDSESCASGFAGDGVQGGRESIWILDSLFCATWYQPSFLCTRVYEQHWTSNITFEEAILAPLPFFCYRVGISYSATEACCNVLHVVQHSFLTGSEITLPGLFAAFRLFCIFMVINGLSSLNQLFISQTACQATPTVDKWYHAEPTLHRSRRSI
jgi:hypothetical protein